MKDDFLMFVFIFELVVFVFPSMLEALLTMLLLDF